MLRSVLLPPSSRDYTCSHIVYFFKTLWWRFKPSSHFTSTCWGLYSVYRNIIFRIYIICNTKLMCWEICFCILGSHWRQIIQRIWQLSLHNLIFHISWVFVFILPYTLKYFKHPKNENMMIKKVQEPGFKARLRDFIFY